MTPASLRALLLAVAVALVACDRAPIQPQPEPSAKAAPTVTPPPSSSAPEPEPEAEPEPAPGASVKLDPARSPEAFAAAMKGTIPCGKTTCRAGTEVCVVAPDPSYVAHCERIAEWIDRRTPRPADGFPPMAGITACKSSANCPSGSVCCLHEIGLADVQAIVCHASLAECRDREELCTNGGPGECRTPETKCKGGTCVEK